MYSSLAEGTQKLIKEYLDFNLTYLLTTINWANRMDSEDYKRIRNLAKTGSYGTYFNKSIFKLPEMDLSELYCKVQFSIDWGSLLGDILRNVLNKLGSFADEWVFLYTISSLSVSRPGIKRNDTEDNEFVTILKVVFRKLHLTTSKAFISPVIHWARFLEYIEKERWSQTPFKEVTQPCQVAKELDNDIPYHVNIYGKLRCLENDPKLFLGHYIFGLDDLIALHRNGKYVLPGKRIDFEDPQYAED